MNLHINSYRILGKLNSHEVDGDSHGGRDQHDGRVDLELLVYDALYRHVHQHACHHPDEQDRRQSAYHLRSVPPEWHSAGRNMLK